MAWRQRKLTFEQYSGAFSCCCGSTEKMPNCKQIWLNRNPFWAALVGEYKLTVNARASGAMASARGGFNHANCPCRRQCEDQQRSRRGTGVQDAPDRG